MKNYLSNPWVEWAAIVVAWFIPILILCETVPGKLALSCGIVWSWGMVSFLAYQLSVASRK